MSNLLNRKVQIQITLIWILLYNNFIQNHVWESDFKFVTCQNWFYLQTSAKLRVIKYTIFALSWQIYTNLYGKFDSESIYNQTHNFTTKPKADLCLSILIKISTQKHLDEMVQDPSNFNQRSWIWIQPWECNDIKSPNLEFCHLLRSYLIREEIPVHTQKIPIKITFCLTLSYDEAWIQTRTRQEHRHSDTANNLRKLHNSVQL